MIPKILRSGKSFKGLAAYLTHDAGAATAERVAWTHTLNCAHDTIASVVNEMLWTWRDADLLKEEAGIRPGGSRVKAPVKHLSLNWGPGEEPSRQEMIESAESFLRHLGWQDHQALLVAHDDKEDRCHLHLMVNRIHPTHGKALDDRFERRRAEAWALEFEREHGKIHCEQRLKAPEEREPSPTREAWLQLKQSEKEFMRGEARLRSHEAGYLDRIEERKLIHSEEWGILKDHLRAQREDFFAEGKMLFTELRKAIYQEVRESFREDWSDYYAAKRDGMDREALSEMRSQILGAQRATLEEWRKEACSGLREYRDTQYRQLLDGQKEMRAELIGRQEQGLTSPHLLDFVNSDRAAEDARSMRGAFRAAAAEVTDDSRPMQPPIQEHEDDRAWPALLEANTRPGLDIAGNLGMAGLGAVAVIGESLFDGFFGWSPTPKQDRMEKRARAPEPKPEFPRPNPFAAYAEEAKRTAAREREQQERDWWDERRERHRD